MAAPQGRYGIGGGREGGRQRRRGRQCRRLRTEREGRSALALGLAQSLDLQWLAPPAATGRRGRPRPGAASPRRAGGAASAAVAATSRVGGNSPISAQSGGPAASFMTSISRWRGSTAAAHDRPQAASRVLADRASRGRGGRGGLEYRPAGRSRCARPGWSRRIDRQAIRGSVAHHVGKQGRHACLPNRRGGGVDRQAQEDIAAGARSDLPGHARQQVGA